MAQQQRGRVTTSYIVDQFHIYYVVWRYSYVLLLLCCYQISPSESVFSGPQSAEADVPHARVSFKLDSGSAKIATSDSRLNKCNGKSST